MANAKLIKALRCKTTNVNDCTMCAYHNACYDGTLESIAADVLETDEKFIAQFIENIEHWKKQVIRLRAQLPKEGEWIQMNGHRYCNVCGHKDSPILTNYCPNCGARMIFNGKQKTESKNIKSSLEYDYCGTPKRRYDIEARDRSKR